jgi:aldose 1-epimerase
VIELAANGARVVLLPELGGRIHQLWLTVDGREEPLLVSPGVPADHRLNPLGGGCYPMAPWPNRVGGATFSWGGRRVALPANDGVNALHGHVFDRPWEVVARVGRVVEMRCEFDDRWPWAGYAWQRIELTGSGLLIKAEVRSRREPFPAGIGLHPWFRREVAGTADVALRVPATSRYVLRDQIPTGELFAPEGEFAIGERTLLGERRLDDCYTGLTAPAEIDWGRVRLEMTVESPRPHVMVYTPPGALCIEPQTCAPDAFNLRARLGEAAGVALAEPGRAVSLVSRWKWAIM